MLDPRRAYQLAGALTTIPECPRSEDAVKALSEQILELCAKPDQAEWLVHEAMTTWPKWQGVYGLTQAYNNQFRPRPERQAYDLGAKPAIKCAQCGDLGFHRDQANRFVWCHCPQAQQIAKDLPDYLELLNRRPKEPGTRVRPEADRQEAFYREQAQVVRPIEHAQAILRDGSLSKEQHEIAREILKTYGAESEPTP